MAGITSGITSLEDITHELAEDVVGVAGDVEGGVASDLR